jgi:hypothetical protein
VFHLTLPGLLVLRGRRDVGRVRATGYGCGFGFLCWVSTEISLNVIGLARFDLITLVATVATWLTVPAVAAWLADRTLGPPER